MIFKSQMNPMMTKRIIGDEMMYGVYDSNDLPPVMTDIKFMVERR